MIASSKEHLKHGSARIARLFNIKAIDACYGILGTGSDWLQQNEENPDDADLVMKLDARLKAHLDLASIEVQEALGAELTGKCRRSCLEWICKSAACFTQDVMRIAFEYNHAPDRTDLAELWYLAAVCARMNGGIIEAREFLDQIDNLQLEYNADTWTRYEAERQRIEKAQALESLTNCSEVA